MKQKAKKTAVKRFKVTSKGKLLRGHAYSSHLKRKKSKSRIRRQKEPTVLVGKAKKRMKRLIGL
ncbi:MAG: bL35 family ribosomal protein [bacterium]|nr:bL35 family ribosomal protein [bacterium]